MSTLGPVVQLSPGIIYSGMDIASAKALGATGDGSTDDTVKLQQALDSLPEGGTLFLARGTYMVSAPLVPGNNISILGEGANSTSIKIINGHFSVAHTAIFYATDIHDFKVSGIRFDGAGSWTSTPFTNPYSAGNSVGFTNLNDGIRLLYSSLSNKRVTITDCEFTGLSRGVVVLGNNNAEKLTITDNTAWNLGIDFALIENIDTFTISRNKISGVYGNQTAAGSTDLATSKFGDGILIESSTNGVISENIITDFIRGGIVFEPDNILSMSANTHTSKTINGIASTANIRVGMWVVGSGVVDGTKVVSVDSSVAITVSIATTTSLTGTTIQFDVQNQGLAISDNVIHDQKNAVGTEHGIGIYIGDGCSLSPISLSNNVIYNIFGTGTTSAGTGGIGIHAQTCTITGGSVRGCTERGIEWDGGDVNIVGVEITENYKGIYFSASLPNPTERGLSIRGCVIRRNTFYGIGLSDAGGGATVEIIGNTIEDNGGGTTPLGVNHEGLGLSGIVLGGLTAPSVMIVRGNTFLSSANAGDTVGQLFSISTYVGATTLVKKYVENNTFLFTGTLAAVGTLPCTYATFTSGGGYTKSDPFLNGVRGNTNNKNSDVDLPVTGWVAYTPKTTGLNFVASRTFTKTFWRRIGDSMEIKGSVAAGGGGGDGSVVQIDVIPTGYTVDNTKICADQLGPVGTAKHFISGDGHYFGIAMGRTDGTINFVTSKTTASLLIASSIASGDSLHWHVTIPISEFA